MLILESKPKEGTTFFSTDYSLDGIEHFRRYRYYRKVERQYKQKDFLPVGKTLYPIGTTVKDALLQLSERRELFNSTDPEWLAYLQDRSTDAGEGEELTSTFNPTIYRLRQVTEGE